MNMPRRQLLATSLATVALMPAGQSVAMDTGAIEVVADGFAQTQNFNGVIAVAIAGRSIMSKAYGVSDVRNHSPASTASTYAIGSISKWFTAAMVLRLAEIGLLRLDTPLSTLLPDFPTSSGATVTLAHLLSNTSGLPDLLMPAAKANSDLRTSNASAGEMVTRFAPTETKFVPGSDFDYAFMNWVIVRAVIEAQNGARFEDLAESLLLKPMGLANTGIASRGFEGVPGLVPAFDGQTVAAQLDMSTCYSYGAASGTFYSDAADLLTFADRLLSGSLLTPQSKSELLKVRYLREGYALGGRVRVGSAGPVAWETGSVGGYKSLLTYRPSDRRSVVVLNNTDMSQTTINDFAASIFDLPSI
ncbi:serine hydrolase domain-containing protein [Brevundimonas diminuta]|uniref:serine hydrolase domain-containing protein n=1 Tax=Brevundimonas diminuta TaxID=293 RepID=UPI001F574B66|nr:serine hydrolase domain-containing protein [Brevundimonas diminuta]